MIETTPIPPFNRNAIIGFISAILALLALCAGILPVPFTALICYPPGIILGVVSLVLSIKAQRELRTDGKSGKLLAQFALWIGGFSLLSFACMITAGTILVPRVYEYLSRFIN